MEKETNLIDKLKNIVYWLILVSSLLFIYGPWFLPGDLTWGDWYTWPKAALLEWRQFNIWWDQTNLGRSFLDLGSALWAPFFWLAGQMVYLFNLPFNVTSRIIWYGPYIIFSLISMPILWKEINPRSLDGWFIATYIYTINTYALLLTMGGHISVAIVYAMTPLLIALSLKSIKSTKIIWILGSTIVWIIASYYEPRITLLAIFLTFLSSFIYLSKQHLKSALIIFGWYGLSLLLTHLWWVVPLMSQRSNTLIPSTHLTVDKSYINLTHALLLYHPQWPDNILGHINSVPIFYAIFPVLIIIVNWLAWKRNQFKKTVIILSLLYLLGAFLSKGDNSPFGGLYHLFFDYLVFFKPFRDASKFMILLMFASSIILGLGFYLWKGKFTNYKFSLGILAIISYLLVIFIPVLALPYRGTFSAKKKPDVYKKIDQIIEENKNFSRTIWMPRPSRFSFFSTKHPNINLTDVLYNEWLNLNSDAGESINFISSPIANLIFDTASIQYLAIPYDSENDIYKDYKPQKEYISAADNTTWLKIVHDGDIKLYKNANYYPKISTSNQLNVLSSYKLIDSFLNKNLNQDKYSSYIIPNNKSDQLYLPQPTNIISGLQDVRMINSTTYQAKLPIYWADEYEIEKKADITSIKIDGHEVQSDKIFLSVGIHDLSILKNSHSLQQKNLLLERNITNCGASNDVSVFNQTYKDKNKIQLLSTGHASCIAIELENLIPESQYEISLIGDLVGSGEFKTKVITESGDDRSIKYNFTNHQKNYTTNLQFKTAKNVQHATLLLQIIGNNAEININQLNFIGPNDSLAADAVIFQKRYNHSTQSKVNKPEIIIDSPAHHRLRFTDVKDDFYLNFSTSYHPNWQASIITNENTYQVDQHYVFAGWANGWKINQTGDFIIDLVFTPKVSFDKWKYISSCWLLLLLLSLLITIVRQKKSKKVT